ncbi:SIMPL domain-containing protein [Chitinivorax sp. B]|uniref:SIMPL domain-containing protein n=1 Tax=Chitinivorax sp. B TaxID=2502235 RepID=UPI0010F949AC|nr:SIMPL domain-containing protein [Chitinivorax sp. B]
MEKGLPKALVTLGILLALGMSVAAFLLGTQTRHIGSGRQNISVKGLAEKPVKADLAEWSIGVSVHADTFADALSKLRQGRPVLDTFLEKQGFDKATLKEGDEDVTPNMIEEETQNGQFRQVQKGFVARQSITVTSKDLAKIATASKAALQLEADGHPVFYSKPLYLVSNLEEVKMSLIGAATQNAKKRADEFAKYGDTKVGSMRSASQGAFYILPTGSSVEANDYGGVYDKSTIDKIARVVVTIDYNLDQ